MAETEPSSARPVSVLLVDDRAGGSAHRAREVDPREPGPAAGDGLLRGRGAAQHPPRGTSGRSYSTCRCPSIDRLPGGGADQAARRSRHVPIIFLHGGDQGRREHLSRLPGRRRRLHHGEEGESTRDMVVAKVTVFVELHRSKRGGDPQAGQAPPDRRPRSINEAELPTRGRAATLPGTWRGVRRSSTHQPDEEAPCWPAWMDPRGSSSARSLVPAGSR